MTKGKALIPLFPLYFILKSNEIYYILYRYFRLYARQFFSYKTAKSSVKLPNPRECFLLKFRLISGSWSVSLKQATYRYSSPKPPTPPSQPLGKR